MTSFKFPDKFTLLVWLGLTGLFISVTYTQIISYDFWWHLRCGGELWLAREPMTMDAYSYTAAGNPWFNFHGLYQLLIAGVYQLGGMAALSSLKTFLFIIVFVAAIPRRTPHIFLEVTLLCLLLALSVRPYLRPEILSLFYLMCTLRLLHKPSFHTIWALPMVTVLWANSHSLFLMPLVCLGLRGICAAFHERKTFPFKRWGFICLLSILAACLSPYGVKGLLFPLGLISKVTAGGGLYKQAIAEFAPPMFFSRDWKVFPLLCMTLLTIGASLKSKQKFPAWILSFLLLLALQAKRNVNLVIFPTYYYMALLPGFFTLQKKLSGTLKCVLRLAVLSLCLLYSVLLASNRMHQSENSLVRFGSGWNDIAFSRTLPEFLRGLPKDTRIFNGMSLGGFLIYHTPHLPVFYDGRLDVYGPEHFRTYLQMTSSVPAFQTYAPQFGITCVILNHSISEASALLKLNALPEWELLYLDHHTVVFGNAQWIQENKLVILKKESLENLNGYLSWQGMSLDKNDQQLLEKGLQQTLHSLGFPGASKPISS